MLCNTYFDTFEVTAPGTGVLFDTWDAAPHDGRS